MEGKVSPGLTVPGPVSRVFPGNQASALPPFPKCSDPIPTATPYDPAPRRLPRTLHSSWVGAAHRKMRAQSPHTPFPSCPRPGSGRGLPCAPIPQGTSLPGPCPRGAYNLMGYSPYSPEEQKNKQEREHSKPVRRVRIRIPPRAKSKLKLSIQQKFSQFHV